MRYLHGGGRTFTLSRCPCGEISKCNPKIFHINVIIIWERGSKYRLAGMKHLQYTTNICSFELSVYLYLYSCTLSSCLFVCPVLAVSFYFCCCLLVLFCISICICVLPEWRNKHLNRHPHLHLGKSRNLENLEQKTPTSLCHT